MPFTIPSYTKKPVYVNYYGKMFQKFIDSKTTEPDLIASHLWIYSTIIYVIPRPHKNYRGSFSAHCGIFKHHRGNSSVHAEV